MRLLLVGLACFACDPPPPEVDAGGEMDSGSTEEDAGPRGEDAGPDAGSTGEDGGPNGEDAGVDGGMPDAGPPCGPNQHLCDTTCTDEMANEVANGCRLGCGTPCPGADAICNADGTCGRAGCTPMTCEQLNSECGPTDDSCGTLMGCGTCTAPTRCESNRCVCDPDVIEGAGGNDTDGDASMLTQLTDNPDSMVSISTPTIHRSSDVDWYRVPVVNNCCGGDPVVTVTLDGLPAGEDYDLGAWYDCPGSGVPRCDDGTDDSTLGSGGCTSRDVGSDTIEIATRCNENGVLFVRVTPFMWQGSCESYTLTVAAR